MNKKFVAAIAVAFVSLSGTAGYLRMNQIYAANSQGQQYSFHRMAIYHDGQLINKPLGIYAIDPSSNSNTTYMPIWYVMSAISKMGIKNSWDGTNWNITLPTNLQQQFSPNQINPNPGEGKLQVWIDNILVQRDTPIVTRDPDGIEPTTYIPIWYVGKILNDFGIQTTWDGTNWIMKSPNGISVSGGLGVSGSAGGINGSGNSNLSGGIGTNSISGTGSISNTLMNTLNSTAGSLGNTLTGSSSTGSLSNILSGSIPG